MGLVCDFVDAIEEVPAVRFDLHDGASTTVLNRDTVIGQPELLQAYNASLLVDGGVVGSSAYGLRRLHLRVQITSSSSDDGYSLVAALLRELDRDSNYLRWQPDGVANPVFFETIRSQPGDIDLSNTGVGIWELEATIKAKPFALGLRETLGPFTINNDPANGSNGLFVDVTGVLGDVATPVVASVISSTGSFANNHNIAIRQHGTPSDLTHFKQAESMTLGSSTANPGGGPDSAMSGNGTNNFVRVTPGVATFVPRITWDIGADHATAAKARALAGTYRAFVVTRRSDATSVWRVGLECTGEMISAENTIITLGLDTNRNLVDLGLVHIGGTTPRRAGHGSETGVTPGAERIILSAARDSGTGTLDLDHMCLLPADESMMIRGRSGAAAGLPGVIDGYSSDATFLLASGSAFDGTGQFEDRGGANSGRFPLFVPNQTNRLYWLPEGHNFSSIKTVETIVTLSYWPRFLHVRPAA